MNYYEMKKAARVERLLARAEKKEVFAQANGLDLYGEEKSGIPIGQPILVGHHSEARHRKALNRIESRVRRGFQAAEDAEKLRLKAQAAETRTAIDTDNPEAPKLLQERITRLESERERYKVLNSLVRKYKNVEDLAGAIATAYPETKDPVKMATGLLTPDFAGRLGIPSYQFTNLGAEIRRLKKRAEVVLKAQQGFEAFSITTEHGAILVELIDGQIQVAFPFKPDEETRSRLKRSPLALKWSSYSRRWVRKHTETTMSEYFRMELEDVLKGAKP